MFQKRQGPWPPPAHTQVTFRRLVVVTDDTREAKEKLEREVTPLILCLLFVEAIWGSSNGIVQETNYCHGGLILCAAC
jgi:hypothetical protein